MLCHASPQERPTGRSGTASAGSGQSGLAEVPSFSRLGSWRVGRLFTAGAAPILPTGRRFVYLTQVRTGRVRLEGKPVLGHPHDTRGRGRRGCYTDRLACRQVDFFED